MHSTLCVAESSEQNTLDDEMNNLDSDDDTHIPGGNTLANIRYWFCILFAW